MDIAVTSSAGTTKELWNTFASTFEKMSDFEIIDMKRFEKTKTPDTVTSSERIGSVIFTGKLFWRVG